MSMDDIGLYMARREKSTLTAPNPESSPNGTTGLLNPPLTTSNMSALAGAVNGRASPTSNPQTPQGALYFQTGAGIGVTPQGSLSHLPAAQMLAAGGGPNSGSNDYLNNTGSGANSNTLLAGVGSGNSSSANGNNNTAAMSRSMGTPTLAANPLSNNSIFNTLNAGVGGGVGQQQQSLQGTATLPPSAAVMGGASSRQQQHFSDVARLVLQHQREAHSDPLRVTKNAVTSADSTCLDKPKCFSFETGDTGLVNFLMSVPHLYMCTTSDLHHLSRQILRREFNLHDTILVNKQRVNHVYIVLKGRVEVYSVSQLQWDPKSNKAEDMVTHHERIGSVEVANMFCIDSVVFSEQSEFLYCAGAEKTLLGLIPAPLFLSIMNRNVAMRQSIGRKLADHMDIFICFKDFCRHIFSHETAKHEYLPLWQILHAYERLENCIHTKRASTEIDVDAWSYAINRLPKNLTTTFVFDLVRALPPFLTTRMKELAKNPVTAIGDVRYIVTKERRRCSWQLGMEGKTLVLLRDSFTDMLDFITCLCIHIIESNKLRGRLQGMVSPPAVDILDAKLNAIALREASNGRTADGGSTPVPASNATPGSLSFAYGNVKTGVEPKDIREVLSRMPLTEKERNGLHRNWGDTCLQNIYAVIMHREEYLLRVDASNSRQFMTDPFHEWSLNLRKKLMQAMKLNPQGHLPDDLIIDIISSNTHSTKSLLSSFPREHRDAILLHAKETKPELYNLNWAVQEDLVYSNCRSYMDATGNSKAFNDSLKRIGFEILEDTAMTGLQVDIVPVSNLDMSAIDPLLATRNCAAAGPRHFILNMDFAFGAQADGITATLVETFGKHIRSFNVMGKAGGIASSMRRGDIQLASHVLLSKSSVTTEDYLDELRSCGNLDITTDFVQSLCGQQSKIQVFNGPVLTIPGTMLQNDKLLLYYRHIWHCVGVEMEGSYFARQLKENIKAKLLREDVITRFAYYTSDMPLHSLQGDASLSTPMRPNEGTPPLYAVARALLIRILGGSDLPQRPELEEVCGPCEMIRNQLAAAEASNPYYASMSAGGRTGSNPTVAAEVSTSIPNGLMASASRGQSNNNSPQKGYGGPASNHAMLGSSVGRSRTPPESLMREMSMHGHALNNMHYDPTTGTYQHAAGYQQPHQHHRQPQQQGGGGGRSRGSVATEVGGPTTTFAKLGPSAAASTTVTATNTANNSFVNANNAHSNRLGLVSQQQQGNANNYHAKRDSQSSVSNVATTRQGTPIPGTNTTNSTRSGLTPNVGTTTTATNGNTRATSSSGTAASRNNANFMACTPTSASHNAVELIDHSSPVVDIANAASALDSFAGVGSVDEGAGGPPSTHSNDFLWQQQIGSGDVGVGYANSEGEYDTSSRDGIPEDEEDDGVGKCYGAAVGSAKIVARRMEEEEEAAAAAGGDGTYAEEGDYDDREPSINTTGNTSPHIGSGTQKQFSTNTTNNSMKATPTTAAHSHTDTPGNSASTKPSTSISGGAGAAPLIGNGIPKSTYRDDDYDDEATTTGADDEESSTGASPLARVPRPTGKGATNSGGETSQPIGATAAIPTATHRVSGPGGSAATTTNDITASDTASAGNNAFTRQANSTVPTPAKTSGSSGGNGVSPSRKTGGSSNVKRR